MAAGKAILDISLPALFQATACVPRGGDERGGGGGGNKSFTHTEHRASYCRGNKIKSRPKFLTILATNKFYILLFKIDLLPTSVASYIHTYIHTLLQLPKEGFSVTRLLIN